MRTKITKLIVLTIIACMMLPHVLPVLAYAESGKWTIALDSTQIPMSAAPVENELGTMVNATDIAKAFNLEYEFDTENKAFIMYDDVHGKIVLMHNATKFYSGDNIYECAPYFYVQNGIPMVEAGFFCNMFCASYTCDNNKIIIDTTKIGDNVAKLVYNGNETPLYMEPVITANGTDVTLEDMANSFGLEYTFNPSTGTAVLSDGKILVTLTDGATSFTSTHGTFECGAFFNVVNGVPMIDVGFFCDLYSLSCKYDRDTKTFTVTDKAINDESPVQLMGYYESYLSGTVNYPEGAPAEGLNVQLILQKTGSRYVNYQGYSYYKGNSYVLDTLHFEPGETSKSYYVDVSDYYSSSYTTYELYYEESEQQEYGYYSYNGTTIPLSYSPFTITSYNMNAKQFSYTTSNTADILAGKTYVSGTISLDDYATAPSDGLDVSLVIQTRSATYTNRYGTSTYYYIGNTSTLGTVHIPYQYNYADYRFAVSDYLTNANSYGYYSLYYSIGENVCAEPYGYYNTSGGTTKISSIPTSGTSSNTGIMAFDFMSSRNVNFTLPIKEGYISGVETVKAPTASYAGGKVPYETRIVLSTQTDGADIYYTTDGSEPTVNSSKYTQPIILTNDTILKAMAVKDGMTSSSVSTYTYIVQTDDLYKITAGQYDAVINGNILTMDVAPVADNGNIYAPVRFLGEAMGASVSYNSELGQVTYYISGKSVTYTIGDKDCFIINGRTMVNAKTLLKDLLGDGYKVECNGISVVANEKTAEDICPVTTKTTIQAVGSYYLAAIAVNNPTDDMKILIAAYDESGKMLCAEFADMSTMQAILSKETGIAYFKTFVLGANLKPLSFAEIAY